MKFDVLTTLPNMLTPMYESVIGNALKKKYISLSIVDIRDFSEDKVRTDDTTFGGGARNDYENRTYN